MTILGFDTETCNGQLRVLASSSGHSISFAQNAYTLSDVEKSLKFLYEEGLNGDGYNVFWNINFDYSIILKPYIVEHEQELHDKRIDEIREKQRLALEQGNITEHEADVYLRFEIGSYALRLVSHKGFVIKRGRKSVYFFDAANFYMSADDVHMSLDTAGERYLHIGKDEWGRKNRERMGSDPEFFNIHQESITKYCIEDCKLTARLFEKTIESYRNLGLNFPEHPYSKASIFKQYLRDHETMTNCQNSYQTIKAAPIFRLIKDSYHGALNQIFGVGTFKNITDADINSAYPTAMRKLIDLTGAEMIEYGAPEFDLCDYKFYEIESTATDLLGIQVYNTWTYPVSKKPVKFAITEWDRKMLDEWKRDYKIIRGVGIRCHSDNRLFSFIDDFFIKKAETKAKYGGDSVEYSNIKIFLNAGYGVLAEHKVAETSFTNYIYASYITAEARYTVRHIQLEVQKAKRQVISISTDGVTYTGSPIHENSDEIGRLSVKTVDEYVSFGHGIYIKDDSSKRRGFYNLNLREINSPVFRYSIKMKPRPLSLVSAIIQKRTRDIGLFVSEEKDFSPYDLILKHADNPELIGWTIADYFRGNIWLKPYTLTKVRSAT